MKTFLVLCTIAAAPIGFAATSGQFLDYRDYLLPGTPEAAVIADVNHDHIPDAVVATFSGTSVLLGHGDGTFARPSDIPGPAQLSLAVADFNNDGHPDIVATILTNGTQLTLALGRGNGTFLPAQLLSVPCVDCYLAAADFNRDGNMDLAVASTSGVTVFLGDGHGSFRGGFPTYSTSFATAVTTGDVNRDGIPDLVVADFGAGTLVVLIGSGNGTFRRADYPNGTEPYQPVLADFNGDGLPDLAAPDRASNSVFVRLNQGGGVFGPSTTFPAVCSPFGTRTCTLEGLVAGDFNGDGKLDLATPGAILHGNGDGSFQAGIGFYSGNNPTMLASGDFNRDGAADLFVVNGSATNLSVLLGNASSVGHPPRLAPANHPKALAGGDFNGDGIADVAVAASGDNAVHVFLGGAGGVFRQQPDLSASQPGAVVAADFNRDGRLDLAVSGSATSIFLGNGDGTFTAGQQGLGLFGDCTMSAFQTTAAPCLVAADFNGDGIPDLAGGNWLAGTVSFLLGNGDGTFRGGPPSLQTSDNPAGLVAGDFNHDGHMDVAVSGYFGTVTVFPGNGDGTFGPPTVIRFGSTLAGLAAGDLNDDGNLDLVVGGGSGSSVISLNVQVAAGNGDMTFQQPINLLADEAPNGIVLGDFNADGLLDIAAPNNLGNDVSVFLNAGNLKFEPAVLYGAGTAPGALAAGDFNGDGRLDLLVANQFSNDVTVLLHAPR